MDRAVTCEGRKANAVGRWWATVGSVVQSEGGKGADPVAGTWDLFILSILQPLQSFSSLTIEPGLHFTRIPVESSVG